jgi:hypothetical protein
MSKVKIELATQTVEMREPKVKDMRAVDGIESNLEREIKMLVNLCEMTEEEIDDLSSKDFAKLDEQLQSFL